MSLRQSQQFTPRLALKSQAGPRKNFQSDLYVNNGNVGNDDGGEKQQKKLRD